MITDGKIRVNIGEREWKAFPTEKQERLKLILQEEYGFCDIDQLINFDKEDEEDGRH